MSSALRRHAASVLTALAVCVGLLGTGTAALADDRDDLARQRERNAVEREQLQSSLEGVDSNLAETYLALEDANRRLPIAQQELAQAESALAAAERVQQQVTDRLGRAEAEQATLATEITAAQDQIAGSQEALGELARTTYRGGNSLGSLQVVLDASSTEDFMRQYTVRDTAVRTQTQVLDDLETASAVARNRQARQDAVTERIGELKAEADAAVIAADAARAEAAAKEAEIQELKESQERLAADLEAKQADLEGDIHELEATDADLAREIARIDEENRRRAEEERRRQEAAERERRAQAQRDSSSASRGESRPPATGGGSAATFGTPVPNPMWVTSPYGMRLHPLANIWWMHEGVDVRSACGAPQRSMAAGTVAATRPAGGNGSHGNQVLINHGMINGSSYITVHNHLTRFAVGPGQRVGKGQVIGYTGATGNVTGCHVHFEVWRNGSAINPMGLPGYARAN